MLLVISPHQQQNLIKSPTISNNSLLDFIFYSTYSTYSACSNSFLYLCVYDIVCAQLVLLCVIFITVQIFKKKECSVFRNEILSIMLRVSVILSCINYVNNTDWYFTDRYLYITQQITINSKTIDYNKN